MLNNNKNIQANSHDQKNNNNDKTQKNCARQFSPQINTRDTATTPVPINPGHV